MRFDKQVAKPASGIKIIMPYKLGVSRNLKMLLTPKASTIEAMQPHYECAAKVPTHKARTCVAAPMAREFVADGVYRRVR